LAEDKVGMSFRRYEMNYGQATARLLKFCFGRSPSHGVCTLQPPQVVFHPVSVMEPSIAAARLSLTVYLCVFP